MTSNTEYKQKLADLNAQIEAIKKAKEALKAEWADRFCPLVVGDIAQCGGYSHTGKPAKIAEVSVKEDWRGDPYWNIKATVLKKDGTESLQKAEWTIRIKNEE